ncbi:unnamed protein product [Cylindrotheca closterium]|uniref:Uncharacterized protein n=1 Tax=Cylindrotheca closterium TaxID=2856 RepID=A0AAD2FCY8_9STRA|nr:unnamed protein product [Cylindrotheca closterium]
MQTSTMLSFSSLEKHVNLLQDTMDPTSVMDLGVSRSSASVTSESSKLQAMEEDDDMEFFRKENEVLHDKLGALLQISEHSYDSSNKDLECLRKENEILHDKLERCIEAILGTSSYSC